MYMEEIFLLFFPKKINLELKTKKLDLNELLILFFLKILNECTWFLLFFPKKKFFAIKD